jgi:hypothetical protein
MRSHTAQLHFVRAMGFSLQFPQKKKTVVGDQKQCKTQGYRYETTYELPTDDKSS